MLNNCSYDTVKVLKELSSLAWFLQKHAIPEEKKANHAECLPMYEHLLKDLEKHINVMKKIVE